MREIGAIRLENVLCFFPCVFRACTCPGFSDLDSSLAFSSSPPFFYAVALHCFVKIQRGGDDRGREKMKVGTPPPLGVTTKACTGQKPRTRLLLFLLLYSSAEEEGGGGRKRLPHSHKGLSSRTGEGGGKTSLSSFFHCRYFFLPVCCVFR